MKPISAINASMEEEFTTAQLTMVLVFVTEFTTNNLFRAIVSIPAPQFQSNIMAIQQLDFAKLHVHLDISLWTIPIVVSWTVQRLQPSLDFCFLGTIPIENVCQNVLIHNLMHILSQRTVTVMPLAPQEHMPLMPKTEDA
jgi:hypothetical protein